MISISAINWRFSCFRGYKRMNTPSYHLPKAKSPRTAFLVSHTLRSDPFEGGFRRFRKRGLAGVTLLEVTPVMPFMVR